jgi:hypothetical protein
MKKITDKTILKKGDTKYQPVVVDKIIYWLCLNLKGIGWYYANQGKNIFYWEYEESTPAPECFANKIVAQSKYNLEGVPVIDLQLNNTRLILDRENPFDLFSYTEKDIKKAITLARQIKEGKDTFELDGIIGLTELCTHHYDIKTEEEILNEINLISIIEVDDDFIISSYE